MQFEEALFKSVGLAAMTLLKVIVGALKIIELAHQLCCLSCSKVNLPLLLLFLVNKLTIQLIVNATLASTPTPTYAPLAAFNKRPATARQF